jgi:6-phosphofructokinase 2
MKNVVTVTLNPTIDKSASIDKVEAEKKLRCGPPGFEPGGGGINVSRALAILGKSSTAFHTSGGPLGKALESLLEDGEIHTRPYSVKQWTRENLTIYEESSGEQYRFGMPGPELSEREWRGCLESIESIEPNPEILVASGSLPPGAPSDFYGRLARIARKTGASMVLDTSGEALIKGAEEGVFMLKPNRRELRTLINEENEDLSEEAMARELIRSGKCSVVVVSMGSEGAIVSSEEGTRRLSAPSVSVRSKVGAGDSMVAGMVYGMAMDWPIMESIRFGVGAGAAAVMTAGTELCRKEDVWRLYKEMADKG